MHVAVLCSPWLPRVEVIVLAAVLSMVAAGPVLAADIYEADLGPSLYNDGTKAAALWTARLGTTAQGFPITFMVDGKQYIAVTTGTEGGSPVQKPTTLQEDRTVFRPHTGQAVYVFALPDE